MTLTFYSNSWASCCTCAFQDISIWKPVCALVITRPKLLFWDETDFVLKSNIHWLVHVSSSVSAHFIQVLSSKVWWTYQYMSAAGQIRASLVRQLSLYRHSFVITHTTASRHRHGSVLPATSCHPLVEPCRYLHRPPTMTAAVHVIRLSLRDLFVPSSTLSVCLSVCLSVYLSVCLSVTWRPFTKGSDDDKTRKW